MHVQWEGEREFMGAWVGLTAVGLEHCQVPQLLWGFPLSGFLDLMVRSCPDHSLPLAGQVPSTFAVLPINSLC